MDEIASAFAAVESAPDTAEIIEIHTSLTFDADISAIAPGTPQRVEFLSAFAQQMASSLGGGFSADRIIIDAVRAGSIIVDFHVIAPASVQQLASNAVQAMTQSDNTIEIVVNDVVLSADTSTMAPPAVSAPQPASSMSAFSASRVEVRISPTDYNSVGTLQMRFDGQEWGNVCDDGFGAAELRVICETLGFSAGPYTWHTVTGNSDSFAADDLHCGDGASSLSECDFMYDGAPYTDNCDASETVHVRCEPSSICTYLADGFCDEPSGLCPPGSDPIDCNDEDLTEKAGALIVIAAGAGSLVVACCVVMLCVKKRHNDKNRVYAHSDESTTSRSDVVELVNPPPPVSVALPVATASVITAVEPEPEALIATAVTGQAQRSDDAAEAERPPYAPPAAPVAAPPANDPLDAPILDPIALSAKTVRELRELAAANGATEDAIEEARDSDDPRELLVALIEQLQPQAAAAGMARPGRRVGV